MRIPEIDDIYLAETDTIPNRGLEQLCFRAQEILSAYCLYDYELSIPEDTPQGFKPAVDNKDEDIEEGALEIGDMVSHEKTNYFEVAEDTSGYLDNIPLVVDDNGNIQQLIEVGFVSLKVIHGDDYDDLFTNREITKNNQSTQIIFRLPWHFEGPAIFQGFKMTDDERIDINDETEEALHNLLEDIVDVLRFDLKHGAKHGTEEYCVQNMPVESIGSTAMKFLMSKGTLT